MQEALFRRHLLQELTLIRHLSKKTPLAGGKDTSCGDLMMQTPLAGKTLLQETARGNLLVVNHCHNGN
jgi:hypothetical protein